MAETDAVLKAYQRRALEVEDVEEELAGPHYEELRRVLGSGPAQTQLCRLVLDVANKAGNRSCSRSRRDAGRFIQSRS